MKKYFNVLHSDLILEEKKENYFVLLSSVFSNKRLRGNYAKNLIDIGLYVPLNEDILTKAIKVKLDETHLKLTFSLENNILEKEYLDKVIHKEGKYSIYIERSLFNEEDLIILNKYLK